jgi:hypothetical protein
VIEAGADQADQAAEWLQNAMKDGMAEVLDPVPCEVMSGETGLSLENIDALADLLDLHIATGNRRAKKVHLRGATKGITR